MENAKLIHNSCVRLKNLLLQYNDEESYSEYCFKFKKIMQVLDDNQLSIPRILEDFLFDAGLPDYTNPEVRNSLIEQHTQFRKFLV